MTPAHAHVLEINNVSQGYIDLCDHIMSYGTVATPRGEQTIEIQALTVIHRSPRRCLVNGIKRGAKTAIGVAEAAQLIAGVTDPELMLRVSPRFKDFMDNGEFRGAYGPRVVGQFERVATTLKADRESRRAHVAVWRPGDLNDYGWHDYPCTLGFTFHVRRGVLDMHTHMRSNDAWWGFTYDVFQFCVLQLSMAAAIGCDVGSYYHHADSAHIYARDVDKIAALRVDDGHADATMEPLVAALGAGWEPQRRAALEILAGFKAVHTPESASKWTKTAQWMFDVLTPYTVGTP